MRILAKRYAKALALLCKDKGYDFEEVYRLLKEFSASLLQDEVFYRYLSSPTTSQRERLEAAKEYVSKLDLPEYLKNFFLLLVEKNRVPVLPLIVSCFREIVDEMLGQVRGVLKVAAPISDKEKKELEEIFAERVGKRVVLEVEEDPALIGGAVAYIGGMVFDGSVKGNLLSIKEKLIER